MFSSALVLVAQALGIIVFSAVSILLVWVVCGVLFCAVTCGFSCGCCAICQRAGRRLSDSHGHA